MDSAFGSYHFPLRIELGHINFEAYTIREKLKTNKLNWHNYLNYMEAKIPIFENYIGTPIEKYNFIINDLKAALEKIARPQITPPCHLL